MDASEKQMIIQFAPHQTTTLPNWVFLKKILQIILAAKWLVRHSSQSLKETATTFAFPSVWFLFYMRHIPKENWSCSTGPTREYSKLL